MDLTEQVNIVSLFNWVQVVRAGLGFMALALKTTSSINAKLANMS